MSRLLSELLGAREPDFTFMLRSLEERAGTPGVDLRLTGEISSRAQRKLRELGLEPGDTNGEELYQALRLLAQKHDEFVVYAIGGLGTQPINSLLPKLVEAIAKLPIPKTAWALRHSAAKRLLKAQPPKRVMKSMGYKSVDSMLKRADIDEVLVAMRFVESQAWQKQFVKSYKSLTPADFEPRPIKMLALNQKRWGDLAKPFIKAQGHNIVHVKEAGVIGLLPMPIDYLPGFCLACAALTLHYLNEIRLYSAYFKFQQLNPRFGYLVANAVARGFGGLVRLAGQPLHWRTLQRHFSGLQKKAKTDVFAPHMSKRDISWQLAGDSLYQFEPALLFWKGLEHVGAVYDGRPLSLNVIDVAADYCNNAAYQDRSFSRLQECLWDELMASYMSQRPYEAEVINQLDSVLIGNSPLLPIQL